jgi:membrane protease YdiL (CAAX protease family)
MSPRAAGETGAAPFLARARGAGARRLAIWLCLVGLPLGYEASALLRGPATYYGGDHAYWFAGLDVHLVLTLVGLAAVGLGLWRSRRHPSTIGWPSRLRWWEWVGGGALVLGALLLAAHNPGGVSGSNVAASASTPATPLERFTFAGVALLEAVGQELIWRGALITWLEPSLGTAGAALFAGASYVFFHPAFTFTWGELLTSVLVAAAYTTLFLWRRSIGPPALLHFLVVAGQLLVPIPT